MVLSKLLHLQDSRKVLFDLLDIEDFFRCSLCLSNGIINIFAHEFFEVPAHIMSWHQFSKFNSTWVEWVENGDLSGSQGQVNLCRLICYHPKARRLRSKTSMHFDHDTTPFPHESKDWLRLLQFHRSHMITPSYNHHVFQDSWCAPHRKLRFQIRSLEISFPVCPSRDLYEWLPSLSLHSELTLSASLQHDNFYTLKVYKGFATNLVKLNVHNYLFDENDDDTQVFMQSKIDSLNLQLQGPGRSQILSSWFRVGSGAFRFVQNAKVLKFKARLFDGMTLSDCLDVTHNAVSLKLHAIGDFQCLRRKSVIFQKLEELQLDKPVDLQDHVVITKQEADKMFPRLVSLDVHGLGCCFLPRSLRRLIIRDPFAVSRQGALEIYLLAELLVARCYSLCELQIEIGYHRHSEGVLYTSEFASSPGWQRLKYISCIKIVCPDSPVLSRMSTTGELAFHLANSLRKRFLLEDGESESIIIFREEFDTTTGILDMFLD